MCCARLKQKSKHFHSEFPRVICNLQWHHWSFSYHGYDSFLQRKKNNLFFKHISKNMTAFAFCLVSNPLFMYCWVKMFLVLFYFGGYIPKPLGLESLLKIVSEKYFLITWWESATDRYVLEMSRCSKLYVYMHALIYTGICIESSFLNKFRVIVSHSIF